MPTLAHLIAAYAVVVIGLGLYVATMRSERARLARELDASTRRGEDRDRPSRRP
jgi:CcmD family protein